MVKKLAFCFLVYDEILNEELWYNFLKDVDPNKYSIYIHYKNHKPSKYFEKNKLDSSRIVPTKWGNVTLIHAHRRLYEEAYTDIDNYKFINVSQSCIPVKTFDYIYEKLTSDNNSIFNEAPQERCLPRCKQALIYISRNKIFYSSEWFILNRDHTRLCLENIKNEYFFDKVACPEDHYFITLVKNKDTTGNVKYIDERVDTTTTFVKWVKGGGSSPKTYEEITREELDMLYKSEHLFARKFAKNFKIIENM